MGLIVGCREDTASPAAPTAEPVAAAEAAVGVLAFRQLTAGDYHTCGVTTGDRAYCWGEGRLKPTPVSGGLAFLEVSAGPSDRFAEGQTCGVTTGQLAYCWGEDLLPVAVPGGRRFRQVSAGVHYACGVTPGDVAFCWGVNQYGRMGVGAVTSSATPVRVLGGLRWRRVFAGMTHTCGVTTDDRAYCWGSNALGQLGDGTRITRDRPSAVAGGHRFRQVKPGAGYEVGLSDPEFEEAYSCGLTTDDRAYCWGGSSSPLGSSVSASNAPVPVSGTRRYDFIYTGLHHACAVNPFDVAFCWGNNEEGQLGTGNRIGSVTPVKVAGGIKFVSLATGGWHTCGVSADQRAYCWGRNYAGTLGDGSDFTSRLTPTPVAPPT